MAVNPAFLQALMSGGQLGAHLAQQQAAKQESERRLQLSWAEAQMRNQAMQQEMAQKAEQNAAALELKRQDSVSGDVLKKLLEEGRNTRSENSLDAHGQRTQDWIDLRIKLAGDANALKLSGQESTAKTAANALEGQNQRAADKLIADDAHFWATFGEKEKELALKGQKIAEQLPYADKERMKQALSNAKVTFKEDSLQRASHIANILDSYLPKSGQPQPPPSQVLPNGTPSGAQSVVRPLPKSKSDMIPGMPYQTKHGALIWNGTDFDL